MELTSFVPLHITSVGDRPHLAWAEGLSFTLPAAVLDRLRWRHLIDASGSLVLPAESGVVTSGDATAVREHAAFTDAPPISSRLPFHYHRVPLWLRATLASLIGRRAKRRSASWAAFPGWPLDLTADFVSDLARGGRNPFADGATPVILSHDIDSAEGLSRLVADFLPCEENLRARSVSYVVPCAWPLNHALLREVVARGHELGIHGYDHGNRTPFVDDAERVRRLDAPRHLVEAYDMVGYRAPSLLRTRALLQGLRSRYDYDSSIPTSGGPFPVPNNGCATARPFAIEGIWEIPVTMPRDGSLRFLGYAPGEIVRLWIECAETIARSGGIVTLLTHCERRFSGGRAMLGAYGMFLEYVHNASDRFVFTTSAALLRRLREPRGRHVIAH